MSCLAVASPTFDCKYLYRGINFDHGPDTEVFCFSIAVGNGEKVIARLSRTTGRIR